MKKTLIAVAALSAMACSAMAAQVTLSGVVDLGLKYKHTDTNGVKTNGFTMDAGQNSGSRVMLKGSEELSEGVEVGFQLENGFSPDDGKLGQGSRLFGRESRLYVKTPYGTIHAGRFGGLDAGTGSLSIFGGSDLSAFGTGWGDTLGKEAKVFKGLSDRYDNSIAYQSPTFAGFTLYLDHSFKNDSSAEGTEGRPSAQQYNAAGLKYVNGAFNAAFVYSQQNYASQGGKKPENSHAYSLGAAYNFGVCKVMAQGQYFDMGKSVSSKETTTVKADTKATSGYSIVKEASYSLNKNEKGWGGQLALTAPVAGGTIYGSVGYKDSEEVDGPSDFTTWNVALAYAYSFSKRTTLYAGAAYTEEKTEHSATATNNGKTKTTEVIAGLVHKF